MARTDPSAQRDYMREYNQRPEVKARRNARRRSEAYREVKRRYDNSPKQRAKQAARLRLFRAVKRGDLTRGLCANCGDSDTQAHHHDYSQPLDVIWLCVPCHSAEHWSG